MPELSSPIQGGEDRLEISQGLDENFSEDQQDDFFEKVREQIEQDKQIKFEEEKEAVKNMIQEVLGAGKYGEFANSNNPAGEAVSIMISEIENDGAMADKQVSVLGDPEKPEEDFLAKAIHEDSVANAALDQKDNPKKKWSKKKLAAVITGLITVIGLSASLITALIYSGKNQANSKKTIGSRDDYSQDANFAYTPEVGQTFLSLLMQAASDAPYDSLAFKDFGISESTYQNLRAQLLDLRDNVSEDAHWQIMTQQATSIFPPTGKPYTLGDHMLALQIQFNLLEQLYDSEPLDLDLDATISTLAEHIDLKADIPILKLYTNMMELVPESSGANRLQRLVLARMAIARAITRAQPSA